MEERAQRIVDAAIQLAEEGGFQNVRLREVAERSGVAFGTLYARFNSKEDILIAALDQEISKFRDLIVNTPPPGDTPESRIGGLFTVLTAALFHRKGFAYAVLRSVASGVPGVAGRIISYQTTMNNLLVAAITGLPVSQLEDAPISEEVYFAARMMQSLWFAELISWISEILTEEEVVSRTIRGCTMLLNSLDIRAYDRPSA